MRTKEEVRLDLVTAVDAYVNHCKNPRAQSRTRDTIEYLLCEADAIRAVERFGAMEASRQQEIEAQRAQFTGIITRLVEESRTVIDLVNRVLSPEDEGGQGHSQVQDA